MLINDAYTYVRQMSEAAVTKYMNSLLQLFPVNNTSISQMNSDFGVADMVLKDRIGLITVVIENKIGGKFSDEQVSKYRSQLAAYMVAAALNNYRIGEGFWKEIEEQHILGILNYELTPIFYKMVVDKNYVQKTAPLLTSTDKSIVPQIEHNHFNPFNRIYMVDHPVTRCSAFFSHSKFYHIASLTIFLCYPYPLPLFCHKLVCDPDLKEITRETLFDK